MLALQRHLTNTEYDKLDEYVTLEGTEIGEYLTKLMDLYGHSAIDDDLQIAVTKELRHWLERFETETKIQTTTYQPPEVVTKELVWIDEE
jgi:hypothetical protein